jgi:hypothetical protein
MSSFPGLPRLLKGSIMLVDPESGAGLARHYNPETFVMKGPERWE